MHEKYTEKQIQQHYNYYMDLFNKNKARVNAVLTKDAIFPNDGEVDPEIIDTIYSLNKLSFLYTDGSCAGHFNTREDIINGNAVRNIYNTKFPPLGYGRYFNGRIKFIFAPIDLSHQFISELETIADKYPDAKFEPSFSCLLHSLIARCRSCINWRRSR